MKFLEMIPKKIFTSFKPNLNECGECKGIIEKWQSLNPDFEVLYFSDEDVSHFFSEYDLGKSTYDILENGVGIADFFRICYIHAKGGIWFDFDMSPFSLMDHINESHLNNENLFFDLGHKNISYMLVSGTANSNLFKKAVEAISENIFLIKDQICGKNIFPGIDITGPHAFQRFISKEFELRLIDGHFPANNINYFSKDGTNFLYTPIYGLTKKTDTYKNLLNKHELKYWRELSLR